MTGLAPGSEQTRARLAIGRSLTGALMYGPDQANQRNHPFQGNSSYLSTRISLVAAFSADRSNPSSREALELSYLILQLSYKSATTKAVSLP
jgi:hypothetical protein